MLNSNRPKNFQNKVTLIGQVLVGIEAGLDPLQSSTEASKRILDLLFLAN